MIDIRKIRFKHLFIALLLVSAFLRLYRLDYPNKYVFDEVYHAFTAKEYAKGSQAAWEWWTTPPPGVAYEWTHPPLAKEIMGFSLLVFQTEDAWAYRLPGTILGILSIYLVYLLGIKLLRSQSASLIAAFVLSIDGLNFVQSRTGMNDIYYVTFLLAALLLLLNRKYFFSALLLGLALSSKWAAIYAYLLFIPLLLIRKDYRQILYFIMLPPVIYLISYIPFFLLGHSFSQFIELQRQMWWYHTHLKASHAYSSPWWSWPLNLYPVWYFVDYLGQKIANIFASGNPLLFWSGSIAVIFTAWDAIKKRSNSLLIIIAGFLMFWLPWALSPRIMFLYHFSPSVPFLSLALGYQTSKAWKQFKNRKLVIALLALIVLGFIYVFPFLTGVPLPKNLVQLFFLSNLSKNPF